MRLLHGDAAADGAAGEGNGEAAAAMQLLMGLPVRGTP